MEIFETIKPEMVAIITVVLVAGMLLTLMMVLITIASLSRAKKRLYIMSKRLHELEEKHASLKASTQTMGEQATGLVETVEKVASLESRLDECDKRTAENQHQIEGYVSKMIEHDTILGQAGQLLGKNAASFNQAIQRICTLEEEFQGLKAFRYTFEQIRNHILDALGARPAKMPQNTTGQEQFKYESRAPSEEEMRDRNDFYKSQTQRYP